MADKNVQLTGVKIIIANDTTANWSTSDKVLVKGEIGIEFLENGQPKFKVGDGVNKFVDLPYAGLTQAEVQNLISQANHSHANKDVLDAIEVALTSALKTNYDLAYTHAQSAHAPSDAQANVIESVSVNDTTLTPDDNKNVKIQVQAGNDNITVTDTDGVIKISAKDQQFDASDITKDIDKLKDDVATNTSNVSTNATAIGTVSDLNTTAKTDVVSAVNEVLATVETNATSGKITVSKAANATEGAITTYEIKQGDTNIGVIDIPKDLVVKSGIVETYTADTLPTGTNAPTEAGTYVVLTIANAEADKIYINVGRLIDIYKAEENATQIQISIDQSTNTISAVIVDGSIVTASIADKAVTSAKLDDSVNASLSKADSAVQSISINGTEVTKDSNNNINITSIPVSALTNSTEVLILDGGNASTTSN
jgi:hypothetical protein